MSVALLLKTELSYGSDSAISLYNSRFSRKLNFGLPLKHQTNEALLARNENSLPLTGWLLFLSITSFAVIIFGQELKKSLWFLSKL